MADKLEKISERYYRRTLGVHLTSKDIFNRYIFPRIKNILYNYIWVDLYAGEGNLILPILNSVPNKERIEFFKNHIYLFDIQKDMVEKSIENAIGYGIPKNIAKINIFQRDNLASFPKFLLKKKIPIFHITNPPYLYLGFIRKHKDTQVHLKYFEEKNRGYQDLYQIAMMNDLRNNIENLIYIIPSNFLFGSSVSNKFRNDLLKHFKVEKMLIFETKVFDYTGMHICLGFFKRKKTPKSVIMNFKGIKIKNNNKFVEREYKLKPEYNYRGGSDFDEFLHHYKNKSSLNVKYYLLKKEIDENLGEYSIEVINSSDYNSNKYNKLTLTVNKNLKEKIEKNILYVRTVDTGSYKGRVGIYVIKEDFQVDGIYVSRNTYRTSPIHIFIEPTISIEEQYLLKNYFNFILEHFREKLDSDFLTTYKYSNANYTRKYLGLTQTRDLIQSFPNLNRNLEIKDKFQDAINNRDFLKVNKIMKNSF